MRTSLPSPRPIETHPAIGKGQTRASSPAANTTSSSAPRRSPPPSSVEPILFATSLRLAAYGRRRSGIQPSNGRKRRSPRCRGRDVPVDHPFERHGAAQTLALSGAPRAIAQLAQRALHESRKGSRASTGNVAKRPAFVYRSRPVSMIRIVRRADRITMPWKNGGGITHELFREPPAPADFDVRLSVAEVASDGPFSIFPGVDRVITLLEGAGFRLDGEGGDFHVVDRIARPLSFRGEDGWMCALLGGPIRDFNVMVRRASGLRAKVFSILVEDRGDR